MTEERQVHDKVKSKGTVTIKQYDRGRLPEHWGQMAEDEKWQYLQDLEPDQETEQSNTTTQGFDQYAVDCMNLADRAPTTYWTALGDDDSVTPSPTDTALNNEVYRADFTNTVDEGGAILFSTYFGTQEANGFTIREVGMFTEETDGLMLNHSLLGSSVAKDSSFALVVDIKIEFTR